MKRVVEFLLLFVPLFAALLWLGGDVRRFSLARRRVEEQDRRLADEVLLTRRGYFVRSVGAWHLRRYDNSGTLLLEAQGKDAKAISPDVLLVKALKAHIHHSQKRCYEVSAPSAKVREEGSILSVRLYGGVRLLLHSDKRSVALSSQWLVVRLLPRRQVEFFCDCDITLRSGGLALQAGGIRGSTTTSKHTFKGPLKIKARLKDGRRVVLKADNALVDTSDTIVTLVTLNGVEGWVDDVSLKSERMKLRFDEDELVSWTLEGAVRFAHKGVRVESAGAALAQRTMEFSGKVHISAHNLTLEADKVTVSEDSGYQVSAKGGVAGSIREWKVMAERVLCLLDKDASKFRKIEAWEARFKRKDGLQVEGEHFVVVGRRIEGEVLLRSGKEWLRAESAVLQGEHFEGHNARGYICNGGLSGHFTADKVQGQIVRVFKEHLLDNLKTESLLLRADDGSVITAGATVWDGKTLFCYGGVVYRKNRLLLRAHEMEYTPQNEQFRARTVEWHDEDMNVKAKTIVGRIRKEEKIVEWLRSQVVTGRMKGLLFKATVAEKSANRLILQGDVSFRFDKGVVMTPRLDMDIKRQSAEAATAKGWLKQKGKKVWFTLKDVRLEWSKEGRVEKARFGEVELKREGMVLRGGRGHYDAARNLFELSHKTLAEGSIRGEKRFRAEAEELEFRIAEEVVLLRREVKAEFEGWQMRCDFCVAFLENEEVESVLVGGGVRGIGKEGETFECDRAFYKDGLWSAEGEPAVFSSRGIVMRERRLVYDVAKGEVRATGGYDWQLDPKQLKRFQK